MSVTTRELQERYGAGEKLNKTLMARLNKELKRTCGFHKCNASLAFKRANAHFCNSAHRAQEVSRLRTANRRKKRRYDERHNTGRKTIKRNVAIGSGIAPGDTFLYEDYKEPLKKIEPGKGFGYYGTVALNPERTHVQCHICGNLYTNVGMHLRAHKMNVADYKEQFGLSKTTALIGDQLREQMQVRAVRVFNENYRGELPEHLKGFNERRKNGELKVKGTPLSLEQRNRLGLCPEQVLEKIKELQDKLGHIPGYDEFRAEYNGRYLASIVYLHGSWSNAVRKVAGVTREDLRRVDRERLIQELIDFKEQYNRIPMTSDFNRGLLRGRGTFIKAFGSLNNARIEAGMNAVVAMPFGQIIELTPEQYIHYQQGHVIPGKISEAAAKKRSYRARRAQLREALA